MPATKALPKYMRWQGRQRSFGWRCDRANAKFSLKPLWQAAGSHLNGHGTCPRQGRAAVPGDQKAVRIPENRAARPSQEKLQDQCDCSSDEPVLGTAAVTPTV